MHEIDHILWEESNLQEGQQRFARATGVTPVFGGKHPGRGSHNSLLALGGNKYLEIIAPDPEQAAAANLTAANFLTAANLNQEKLATFTPRLLTFAVRAYDLTHAQKLMKEAGLEASDLRDGSRQLPSGGMLKWQSMSAGGHEFGRLIPFFIQWGDTTHPSETSPKGSELLEFSVGHPDSERLRGFYQTLQINVPVFQSDYPELRAVLSTPKGKVTLNNREGFVIR
jgi:hypothetical protein